MKFDRIIITPSSNVTHDEAKAFVRSDWEVYVMEPDEELYDVMVKFIPPQQKHSSELFNSVTAHGDKWGGDKAARLQVPSTITQVAILGELTKEIYDDLFRYREEYYPTIYEGNSLYHKVDNFEWHTQLPPA